MKNNNKGFIAISIIYSFFLVFLMTLVGILASYSHNRTILNNVKTTIQNNLESRLNSK